MHSRMSVDGPFMALMGSSRSSCPQRSSKRSMPSQFHFQGQVDWPFLHASLAFSAVRLAFEAFPVAVSPTVSRGCATLSPSPRLQRRGPVRAIRLVLPLLWRAFQLLSASASSPEFPLVWFSKDRPSAVRVARVLSRLTLPKGSALRLNAAKRRTPSAFVVLPDFGGLLRMRPCRFVAPCSRPWGSSGFARGLPQLRVSTNLGPPRAPHARLHTLQSVPLINSRSASPRRFSLSPFAPASVSGGVLRDLRVLLH